MPPSARCLFFSFLERGVVIQQVQVSIFLIECKALGRIVDQLTWVKGCFCFKFKIVLDFDPWLWQLPQGIISLKMCKATHKLPTEFSLNRDLVLIEMLYKIILTLL